MKKLKKFISCVAATALAATSLLGGASLSASADDLISNESFTGDATFIASYSRSQYFKQTAFKLDFKYDVVGTPSAPQEGEPDVGYNDTFEFLVFDSSYGGWNRTTVGPNGFDQTAEVTPEKDKVYSVTVPISDIESKLSTGGAPYGINIQTGAQLGSSEVTIVSLSYISDKPYVQEPFTITGEWTKGTASKMTVDPVVAATVNANAYNIEVSAFDLSDWTNPTVDVTVKYETAQSNVQAEILLPNGEGGYDPVNPYYVSVAAGTTNTYTTEILSSTANFIAAYDGGTVTEIHVYNNTAGNEDAKPVTGLTATQVAANMGLAWNLGNSLDAVNTDGNVDEDAINPITTKKLIQAVKDAGFTTLKLPVTFMNMIEKDENDVYYVNDAYMARIKEVISYAYDMGMYVVLNLHNDGRPTFKDNYWINISQTPEAFESTLDKFGALWADIASNLQEFDQRLIFQAATELMNNDVNYNVGPTANEITNINTLNQTFVNAVRNAGGSNNTDRVLAVVNYRSDIDYITGFTKPSDPTENRLMISFAYYAPTDFTLENNGTSYWDPNGQYGTKYMDTQFAAMKTFADNNGLAVLVGEYGPMFKNNIANVAEYDYWVNYYATLYGIVTAYWDNGETGYGGTALFDRINNKLTADGQYILNYIKAGHELNDIPINILIINRDICHG